MPKANAKFNVTLGSPLNPKGHRRANWNKELNLKC